jgi:hypothetical protein
VSQSNKLKIPKSATGAFLQLNINVTVINQIGNNNFAEVQVNQSNG